MVVLYILAALTIFIFILYIFFGFSELKNNEPYMEIEERKNIINQTAKRT